MRIEEIVEKLTIKANISLREDVKKILEKALHKEKNKRVKRILKIIMENARIALKKNIALCQDTGLPLVFLEVGRDVNLNSSLIEKINKGVISGYKKAGFRKSTIDSRGKLSYTPKIFHIDFVEKEGLKITIFPKGFGSEAKSALKVFPPTVKKEEIDEFIIETVKNADIDACPPYFIGIGIGGDSSFALILAKKALCEDLSKPNKDKELDKWEKNLMRKLNKLGIGIMEKKGPTVLAVRIKRFPTHIAGIPVGVNISCHALRSATVKINF